MCLAFLYFKKSKIYIMGRGDIKTKKGKIFAGSFGKIRSAKTIKPTATITKKEEATEGAVPKKAAVKKAK